MVLLQLLGWVESFHITYVLGLWGETRNIVSPNFFKIFFTTPSLFQVYVNLKSSESYHSGKFRVNSRLNTSRVHKCSGFSCIIRHNSSIMGLLETHLYQTLAALFFGCILFRQLNKSRSGNPKGLPLPPGPKGYPLIGSLFDMPINKPWLVYDEWCKTYGKSFIIASDSLLSQLERFVIFIGDMIYFNVLGQHFLILSSLKRTTDLFEKRSSNYSDRPRLPMLVELYVSYFSYLNRCEKKACFRMEWDFSIGLLPYGVWWRRHRRSFHQYFNINAVSKYQPIQRQEVHAFLRRLLDTPDNFLHHIRQ
jgi:hypothetical protein